MRAFQPFVALVGGAGVVAAFVIGLSALFFDPPTDPADLEAALDPAAASPDATALSDDGVLRISGDRQEILTMGFVPPGVDPAIEFVDPFGATTSNGAQVTLSWEPDPEGALFLRHFQFDGLDFFLQPGECTLTPGDIDAHGTVTVAVECLDISDIRDTATITMAGVVGFSYDQFPPPDIQLGGEVVVGGDLEVTMPITSVSWVIRPKSDDEFPGFELSAYSEVDGIWNDISLGRDDSGTLSVRAFQVQTGVMDDYTFAFFQPEPGVCPAIEELVETTGPATAVYRVAFDCSTVHSTQVEGMESEDLTISLRGELTAHRLDLTGE